MECYVAHAYSDDVAFHALDYLRMKFSLLFLVTIWLQF